MPQGKFKTREEIFAVEDLKAEELYIPEWDTSVYVRGLTGKERDEFETAMIQMNGKRTMSLSLANVRARLVSMACIQADGTRLFSRKDIEILGKKSAAALDRIAARIQELSGLLPDDIKELTENFTEGQSEDSISN
jgi:hypothetical protein